MRLLKVVFGDTLPQLILLMLKIILNREIAILDNLMPYHKKLVNPEDEKG